MEFLTPSRTIPSPDYNAPRYAQVESRLKVDKEPSRLSEFQFAQTIIPLEGGQQSLRLLKPLILKISLPGLRFTVTDWGLEMDCKDLPELPRQIARRFLYLLNAAEFERLSEQEQGDWLRISDYIDFREFTVDRSPPRYQEGVLKSSKEKCIVLWHDGSTEILSAKPAGALADINVGEKFSAHVKLGKNDHTIGLERVSLLGLASDVSEKDWSDWPKKN